MGQGMASKWSWISSPNGLVCVSRTGVHLRPDRLPGREILISGRGLRREDWPSSALWAGPPGKLLDLTGITFFFLFFFFDSNHSPRMLEVDSVHDWTKSRLKHRFSVTSSDLRPVTWPMACNFLGSHSAANAVMHPVIICAAHPI